MQTIINCEPVNYSDRGTIDFREVNKLLSQGYKVISITAQNCSVATGSTYTRFVFSGFAVLVEKDDDEITL